jgi:serine/threonine protein kinase
MYYRVHEDIKPENLLLSKQPLTSPFNFVIKFADFGFSHLRLVGPDGTDPLAVDYCGGQTYGRF